MGMCVQMKLGRGRQLLAMIIGMGLVLPVYAQFWSRDPAALPTPTGFVTNLELGDIKQAQTWLAQGLHSPIELVFGEIRAADHGGNAATVCIQG